MGCRNRRTKRGPLHPRWACSLTPHFPFPSPSPSSKAYAYNTIGIDDCPPEDWEVVVENLDEYVKEYNATAGELNGPRVFTCAQPG